MNNRFLIRLKDDKSDHDIIQNTFANANQKSMFGCKVFKCNWISFGNNTFLDVIVKDGNIECFEQALDSIKSIVSLYEYTDKAASEYRCIKKFDAYIKSDEVNINYFYGCRRADAYLCFLREIKRHALVCLTIHDTITNVDMYTYNKVDKTTVNDQIVAKFTSLSGIERIVPISKLNKLEPSSNIDSDIDYVEQDDYFEYGE